MYGIENFNIFIVSAIVIIIAPGPDFVYVTTRGISDGNKAGILSALGISIGLLVHTFFAAFGLSAIIQTSRLAYLFVKYLGAGYLVYIGIKSFLSNKTPGEIKVEKSVNSRNILKQGILTNVFNPKAIITFMAFLPQFVNVNIVHPILQFFYLGFCMSVIALLWFGTVGYFAGVMGDIFKRSPIIQKVINKFSGLIMIFLGLKLAVTKDK